MFTEFNFIHITTLRYVNIRLLPKKSGRKRITIYSLAAGELRQEANIRFLPESSGKKRIFACCRRAPAASEYSLPAGIRSLPVTHTLMQRDTEPESYPPQTPSPQTHNTGSPQAKSFPVNCVISQLCLCSGKRNVRNLYRKHPRRS